MASFGPWLASPTSIGATAPGSIPVSVLWKTLPGGQ